MTRLIKALISTNCELLVSPRTNVYDEGFIYLEFIVADGEDTIDTLVMSDAPELYRYYLQKDGIYMYYRLKVPTKTKLGNSDLTSRLYYDDTTDKLMIGNDEVSTSKQLEDIVDDDYPDTKYGITEFIEKPIFSICRISSCLENLQRKYIFEGCPSNKGTKCDSKSNEDKTIRDFIFSSVFILRTLIRQQRYEEALRILESINGCNTICNETYTSDKSSCRCNR